MTFFTIPALLSLAALPAAASFHWTSATTKTLAPGVTLTQESQTAPALLVDVLTVDPSSPGVALAPAIANDSLTNSTGDIRKGRENVSALVQRKAGVVLAAVNGDYFPFTGDPLGLGVVNGELYSEPYVSSKAPGRAAIGWTATGAAMVGIPRLTAAAQSADGASFPVTGINRLTATDNTSDLVVCTPKFGPTSGGRGNGTEVVVSQVSGPLQPGKPVTGVVRAVVTGSKDPANLASDALVLSTPAGSPIAAQLTSHFHVGEQATITCSLSDITATAFGGAPALWNDVRQAIGGGPILLRGGRIIVDDAAEGFDAPFSAGLHARTAVGARGDGKVVIVAVDAGSSLSGGMSLADLASLMKSLGAVDAVNLDGGGSTTMVAAGMTVDYPSGSSAERPVADMLTVQAAPQSLTALDPPTIATPLSGLQAGQTIALSVRVGEQVLSGSAPEIVWNGPVGAVGVLTQDGVLHLLHPGRAQILGSVQGSRFTADIDVAAPPVPATISPPAPGPVGTESQQ